MDQRMRHWDPTDLDGQPSEGGGGSLDQMRTAGQRLCSAGDEYIRKGLSDDSQAALQETQQPGGQ